MIVEKSYSLSELAETLSLEFDGDGNVEINSACGLDSLNVGGIFYFTSPKGLQSVPVPAQFIPKKTFEADPDILSKIVVIQNKGFDLPVPNKLYSDDPIDTHAKIIKLLYTPYKLKTEIHASATVGENVKLGKAVSLGPNVVLYDGVSVGDNTSIHAGAVVMNNASIGANTTIYPNAVVREECVIGNYVTLQANCVIGNNGHGYYQRDGENRKNPQISRVIIEDHVEIGSCTTVDRGRLRDTIVRSGSKLDNLVQIAHNVELGENALISAQCAIGGSTVIGPNLIMGGQSGIKDNIKVGEKVSLAARGVLTGFVKNMIVGGFPAEPFERWKESLAHFGQLKVLFERVSKLEKKVKNNE